MEWSPLGSGVEDGGVHALAVDKGILYAAGSFHIAGRKPSRHIARWDRSFQPFNLERFEVHRDETTRAAVVLWDVTPQSENPAFVLYGGWNGTDRLTPRPLMGQLHYQYTDTTASVYGARYLLRSIDGAGVSMWHGPILLPSYWPLYGLTTLANRPNPFRDRTEFVYHLREPRSIRLDIYDVAGRRVATLLDAAPFDVESGEHLISWDGRRTDGSRVPAGVYYARYLLEGQVHSRYSVIVIR